MIKFLLYTCVIDHMYISPVVKNYVLTVLFFLYSTEQYIRDDKKMVSGALIYVINSATINVFKSHS